MVLAQAKQLVASSAGALRIVGVDINEGVRPPALLATSPRKSSELEGLILAETLAAGVSGFRHLLRRRVLGLVLGARNP